MIQYPLALTLTRLKIELNNQLIFQLPVDGE